MPTARRSSRSRAPRRRLFWVRILNFSEITAGGADVSRFNALAQFEQEYGADLFGFTVTRMRGSVKVMHDGTTAVVERREFTFGIRVASQATATTAPPSVAPHEDWMYTLNDAGQLAQLGDWSEYRYEFDIKGQRRVDELQQSLFVYTGFSETTMPPARSEVSQIVVELNILCMRP